MKRSRFSEEQIIGILREVEKGGQSIGEICRMHGITEQTYYRWRRKYGGMEISAAKKLRALEGENAKLKRLLANRDLEIDAMKELVSKNW